MEWNEPYGNQTVMGTKAVAERLGVSKRTTARWCAEGLLPGAYKVGIGPRMTWCVPESAVAELAPKLCGGQQMGHFLAIKRRPDQEQSRLEAGVIEAALAWRKAHLLYDRQIPDTYQMAAYMDKMQDINNALYLAIDAECASCRHYNASRVPGKPGLCTLRGRASHWDSTCEEWEERLPFEEDLAEEEE